MKNLHLAVSAIVVVGVGLIYGLHPTEILPIFFDFEVASVDLHNVFRAIMGLYLAMAGYWIYGIAKPNHWRSASLSNIIFMGGLAFGRIISLIYDGISVPFTKGLILELLLAIWGIYNLKKYAEPLIPKG